MMDRQGRSNSAQRLGGLRRVQPTDVTLKNLLAVLTVKLDLCARLPVCEYEARDEGHDACADAFSELAEAERRSCAAVLDSLRAHLERTTGSRA
jgi:hypothetical protein